MAQARHAPTGVGKVEGGHKKKGTTHLRKSTNALVDRAPLAVLEDAYRLNVHSLVFSPDASRLLWIPVESPVMRIWEFNTFVANYIGTTNAGLYC